MTRPFEFAELSSEASRQVTELWQKLQEEIGLWWPDESRFRDLGQTHKPLVFPLPDKLEPGTLGCLAQKLADQGWICKVDNSVLTIEDAEPIGFKDLNSILDGIANEAVFYLSIHDYDFKPYCFQTAAWTGYKKLAAIAPKLSEPFKSQVVEFLAACKEAHEAKEDTNIEYERYPIASKEIIVLMEKIEMSLVIDPSLKNGVDEKKLASLKLFHNLEAVTTKITAEIQIEREQRAQKESETIPVS